MTSPLGPVPLLSPIRPYAWGSRSFIASLQGRATPSETPEAELWLGAHPGDSSEVELQTGRQPLTDWLANNTEGALGAEVATRFDSELPFLVKVLAAATPLSLQAHPSRTQAREGFAREAAQGLALDAPERSYRDARHKPELIAALTPFQALCGFRPLEQTRRLFSDLNAAELTPHLAPLSSADPSTALRATFEGLLTASAEERARLSRATAERARERASYGGHFTREFLWATRLYQLYPDDIGVTCALLLNLIELAPLQSLYLPAGNLHAYLEGAGVEIMASSDNVLRGGLTPKPINIPELLRVLDFAEIDPVPLAAELSADGEHIYQTPAEEFRLSYFELTESVTPQRHHGPEILLVTQGLVRLESGSVKLDIPSGQAAFIPAAVEKYRLSGASQVFRAVVPT